MERLRRMEAAVELRGAKDQGLRRALEAEAKREAVRIQGFLVLEGGGAGDAARRLRVSRRTLKSWEHLGAGPLPLRGRPRALLDESTRRGITERLEEVGPTLGVEPLKRDFAHASRRAIGALVSEYRNEYAKRHAQAELSWEIPGTVWAMDHTEVPAPGGIARSHSVLALRDLASGKVLEWKENAACMRDVIDALTRVIEEEGAPLVLKSDRGSAFTGEETVEFLNSRGIILLLSPPRCPSYNGSIESSIRWMKLRTAHQARRLGSPLEWPAQALEEAKRIANSTERSGNRGSAEAVWDARPGIHDELRRAFGETVRSFEAALLEAEPDHPGGAGRPGCSSARRQAIERALVAHGILNITRKRIPLRIRSLPWAKIG